MDPRKRIFYLLTWYGENPYKKPKGQLLNRSGWRRLPPKFLLYFLPI